MVKAKPEPSEINEFRVALEALQNQITTRFPTREDISTALAALQMQLEHRFASQTEIRNTKLDALDTRFAAEITARDKAFETLTERMSRQLSQIDDALREHIRAQVAQILSSLESAEKLELGRIDTIDEKMEAVCGGIKNQIQSLSREMAVINSASEQAIAKAEASVEKRFDTFDKAAQGLRDLVNGAMPRAEVITLIKASTEKIGDLTDRINRTEGRGVGMGQIWSYIVGAGGIMVALIAIFTCLNTLTPKVERNSEELRYRQAAPVAPVVPTRP